MEGLQPWCSAALPIITRCCKSCSCEKSPFLYCCWLMRALYPFHFMTWPWLHGVQCNSCSPSDTRSPCVFLSAHVLCLLISLHEELRGRPRAFFSWSYPEDRPQEFKFLPHILFSPCTGWCGLKCQCEGWCCWARVTVTGAVLCLWETLPEQMEYCRSRQWGRGSTAGDTCRESPCSLEGAVGVLRPLWPIE